MYIFLYRYDLSIRFVHEEEGFVELCHGARKMRDGTSKRTNRTKEFTVFHSSYTLISSNSVLSSRHKLSVVVFEFEISLMVSEF